MFETSRERISVEPIDPAEISVDASTHVFAICISRDRVPIVGVRRTSFVYQSIMTKRKTFTEILPVDTRVLKYMYANEVKDIYSRLIVDSDECTPPAMCSVIADGFEELVLLGGCVSSGETIYQCLEREMREESDAAITVHHFGNKAVKLSIEDKILGKRYTGYCLLCFIDQLYREVRGSVLYNFEIKNLCSLLEKKNDEKYGYLHFIYNTLISSK
ncbi:mRNA decapping enzyme [Western grey kangaroopox virus]|uniref:mRNA decapping enzyme n=1 Tax=Western grey kangaroopox virus TaxID=1566307 RepID=A0A2C9DSP8_9POXV|nr:mRNA decapping enzyme [Western grey kangaroopox virus]ATI21031.1 mRNA decapping enzyme [Western grey kangaroopox virus]